MELIIRNKEGIRFGALKGEVAQYYLKDIASNATLFKATTKLLGSGGNPPERKNVFVCLVDTKISMADAIVIYICVDDYIVIE